MATFGSFKFFLSDQRVLRYNLPKFAKGLLLKKGPVTNFNSGVNGWRALNPAYGVIVSIVYVYSLKLSLVSLFAPLLRLRFSVIVFCIIALFAFCVLCYCILRYSVLDALFSNNAIYKNAKLIKNAKNAIMQ